MEPTNMNFEIVTVQTNVDVRGDMTLGITVHCREADKFLKFLDTSGKDGYLYVSRTLLSGLIISNHKVNDEYQAYKWRYYPNQRAVGRVSFRLDRKFSGVELVRGIRRIPEVYYSADEHSIMLKADMRGTEPQPEVEIEVEAENLALIPLGDEPLPIIANGLLTAAKQSVFCADVVAQNISNVAIMGSGAQQYRTALESLAVSLEELRAAVKEVENAN